MTNKTKKELRKEKQDLDKKYLEMGWTKEELKRSIELDELLCVPGSLSHDKKIQKEKKDYLKSISMQGGYVSNIRA